MNDSILIIHAMAGHLDQNVSENDEELGNQLANSFSRPINEIAQSDLPVAALSDDLIEVIRKSIISQSTVIPVCDPERRILGVIDEGQMIRALSEFLSLKPDPVDTGKPEIKEINS